MTRDLTGKVVVITGSARGIGAATARAFIADGARVVIADIDQTALDRATAEMSPALALRLDVSDREAFAAFYDRIETELGPIDILVNNAGVMPVEKVTEISDAMADRVIDVNIKGVTNGTRIALRRMIPRRRGHVINIASALGEMYGPYLADYCGSKHFVVGFTDAARMELKGTGVDMSVVLPGQADTELTAGLVGARGLSLISPELIAAAVVSTARKPRRHTYAPKTFTAIVVATRFLPKAVSEPMLRLLGAENVHKKRDLAARSAYEARALGETQPALGTRQADPIMKVVKEQKDLAE